MREAPTTSAQRGVWWSESLDHRRSAYVVVRAFGLEGPVDADALDGVLRRLVARHDALRTALAADGDRVWQVVQERVDGPALQRIDLTATDDPDGAARDLVAAETDRPFDLTVAPLMRAWLAELHGQRWVLCLSLHHVVIDERSLEILIDEVGVLLAGGRLPEPGSYAEHARREADQLASADFGQRLERRRADLADAPPAVTLPRIADVAAGERAGVLHAVLDNAAVARVVAHGRELGATPFVTVFTVVQAVLYRWIGETDLVVGVPASIRDDPGADRIVGLLVNTVVVRSSWAGNPSWTDALIRVRAATLRALAARSMPFELLVAALPELRAPGRAPVVQLAFGYSEVGDARLLELPGVECRALPIAAGAPKFDLSVDCSLVAGGLKVTVEWDRRYLDAGLARRFVDDVAVAFDTVASDPDRAIGDWELGDGGPADPAPDRAADPLADARWEAFVQGAAS